MGELSFSYPQRIAKVWPTCRANCGKRLQLAWQFLRCDRMHAYEVRPRKDKRGVALVSDALPFRRLWYGEPNAVSNPIGYAKFFSRSHDAVIRVFHEAGIVIETHEHAGEFKEP